MINNEWPLRSLGDLFEIRAGKTMSAAARAGTLKTPFLRTSNVLWDEIDLSSVDEMFIPPHELPARLLRPGDLLVCEGGEIGRSAVWEGQVEVMAFQNHIHCLRPKANDVLPRFYVFFLQSAFTQLGIFEGAGNKTTIPNLSRTRLANLLVPHPPLDVQQRVTSSLSLIREGVRVHERTSHLFDRLFQSVLRKLITGEIPGRSLDLEELSDLPAMVND
ncbi:MAG: restriction endonuclease subunit S [Gemmatimonadaceae bacterium]